MTERINSTLVAFDGASFSPAGDWVVQAEINPVTKAEFEIQARADAAAPWSPIGTITKLTSPPMLSFTKVPFARLVLTGNTAGVAAKAWTGE